MTREQSDYLKEAQAAARECAENFEGDLCRMWRDDRKLSDDLLNDYPDGDSYHHENHTDKAYNLTEAAAVLDQLDDFEETDGGLWEGLAPREAISAQAAYTYANAVYSEWRDIIKDLQEDLDELQSAVEENGPELFYIEVKSFVGAGFTWDRLPNDDGAGTEEEAEETIEQLREQGEDYANAEFRVTGETDADATEEAVSAAGERYIRLYILLAGRQPDEFGGMVGAALEDAVKGERGGALALADAVQESEEPHAEGFARRIRDAAK